MFGLATAQPTEWQNIGNQINAALSLRGRFIIPQRKRQSRVRPGLDEKFLDPGGLASETELPTAIDRSRIFGLVLSPKAVAAKWVDSSFGTSLALVKEKPWFRC